MYGMLSDLPWLEDEMGIKWTPVMVASEVLGIVRSCIVLWMKPNSGPSGG
jgi:hypothetical protein